VSWGVADFVGGVIARRLPVLVLLLGSNIAGVLVTGLIVALAAGGMPPQDQLLFALAAGPITAITLVAFYRALAIGTMSIVAPVSTTGVAIPVAFGIAGGEELSMLAVLGIVLAVPGVMLASREQDVAATTHEHPPVATALALGAAVGFGTLMVLVERSSRTDQFWAVFFQRVSTFAVIAAAVAFVLLRGGDGKLRPRVADLPQTMSVGLLDTAAVTAFAYASTNGKLSVTSVLAAVFPVVTVLLAHRFLGERLAKPQKLGVALTLGGVAALAVS
jgi:drug/metabolite transporter (DMT)-like permease